MKPSHPSEHSLAAPASFDRFSSEYTIKYRDTRAEPKLSPAKGRRVDSPSKSQDKLWAVVGEDKYTTEVTEKFAGHMPPPPAPRALVKYEPDALPFHGSTTYRQSYTGETRPPPDSHKPKAQGAHL